MKKTKAQRRKVRNRADHPLIAQAKSNGANLNDGTFEVAEIGNPYGEVIIRGEVRRHKVVRRVPHYQSLAKAGKIDRATAACLDWLDERLALANSGLIKCGLGVSGGGSASCHVPTTEAAMQARSDVAWARSFIRDSERLAVFDLAMGDGKTFEQIGALVFPGLSLDGSKRKASRLYQEAIKLVYAGVAPRVLEGKRS